MRAFVLDDTTGPGTGRVGNLPEPVAAHPWADGRRLLIDVHAAGVSFPDLLQSRGEYQHATPPPYAPGGEVAGIVLEAPEGSRFGPGDRVASLTLWGGMAERALGLEQYTARLPDTMSFTDGAAIVLNYSTAWFSLYRTGFRSGDTVLVHGAAGGVGTATVQVASALGGTVIGVVSTDAKEEVARGAGAQSVVRSDGDWLSRVKELTNGLGVQIVVDPVGGDRFTDSLRALDVGGRLAVVGFTSGEIPTVKVNRLLLRDLGVVGVALAPYVSRFPEVAERMTREIEELLSRDAIRPVVGHVLPLEDGGRALRLLDDRQATGKVVVTVRE
ncbi:MULTISPECIES: NADPH:quinone oxidoreductase family protein [unclassified Rhodococcus (in: high G+C Gram-positive bacteria)]|uniref:NADPH:quinone oxidoreductase family protein n=1 Tax=unclassified Rhodococcus (in: high G+C Gram-positive bacteria) TaxID=192944 RepID=UPI00163B4AEB|nr:MULTISPECIES: NADPH:quinone oxidoreductase family protein [unclassified Rhodococcus (in: high G+C Gram-positive bacteria)]MBC2642133.1 NADPH:quinone oxidoreductase family protein [Rhodococcus sp. 3A]MBC2893125.1 NADPH:quinone oxidoreductase family protein [Rhodococcus sp. 4CII]